MSSLKNIAAKPLNDIISLPVAVWNSIFKRYRFSDFLPYAMYDEDERVYINNDNTYGAVFECIPRIRMGINTGEAVEEILSKLPEDVFLQFILYGSPNITGIVERWKLSHQLRDEEILKEIINETAEMYYRKAKNETITPTMTTKLRNHRLFISIKGKNREKVQDFKHTLYGILEANRFSPKEMKPQELKPLLWEVFNINHNLKEIPAYDDNLPINRQVIAPNTKIIVKDSHIEIDNKTWISLVPQKLSKYASIVDFSEKLGDYMSKNPEVAQFQDNFIVTMSVCRLPKSKTKIVEKNHQAIASQHWRRDIFRKFARAQDESIEILDRIEAKEVLYAMDLNILVAGDDYKDAKNKANVVINYWNRGGSYKAINLEEALGIHHLNFLASLPMGINEEYVFDTTRKYRSMFAKNIAQYAPLEADFKGRGDNFILITRRSQIASYDLFASDKSFNAYVVATSGAGKSVFLQTIALNSYARGDRVFVLDYDNSFYGLCQAIDAQYVSLNPSEPISFNPFSEIKSMKELESDLAYLSEFIYMLGSNKNQRKAEEEEKLIKGRIQDVLKELYAEYGDKLEITHIRNKLRNESDARFKDFATQLGAFCRGGIYGKFFEGANEFNINKEFIAVEFKEMSEHPDIRDPIIMMLIYHINQMMYSAKGRKNRIQIILDEAHRFLGKNPRMDDFIEQAYRRARKYNGSIILATQGFDDIYDPKSGGLSAAGKVIIANSPWKFFLTQTETSINMLINSDVFNFDEIDKRVLRSIHTRKGDYSELFVITPEEFKLPNRLIMNKFFYYVTTTDPKDKEKIARYVEQGYSYIDAIRQLLKEESQQ